MSSEFSKQLGIRIKTLRMMSQMTQEELAAKIGISAAEMSHYETGRRDMPALKLAQICDVLECDPKALLGKRALPQRKLCPYCEGKGWVVAHFKPELEEIETMYELISTPHPETFRCDQCDLQADCDRLFGERGQRCPAKSVPMCKPGGQVWRKKE